MQADDLMEHMIIRHHWWPPRGLRWWANFKARRRHASDHETGRLDLLGVQPHDHDEPQQGA